MVTCDDIAVESESGQGEESSIASQAHINPDRATGCDDFRQDFGISPQPKMLGHEVLGACGEDAQRHGRSFIDECRNGTIATDGDQAATRGVVSRLPEELSSALRGVQAILSRSDTRRRASTSRLTRRKP